jgi:adenosylmethionine-8-amino-7-oxononanoate aminotransferase
MKDHEREMPLVPIRRGSGAWLEDYDGRRYLDAISSWWVNLFGHANPRISAAVAAQLQALEHVMFAGFTHEPAVRTRRAPGAPRPPGPRALLLRRQRLGADRGRGEDELPLLAQSRAPRKTRFITLANSYHGETLGALAVGDVELYKAIYRRC